MRCRRSIGLTTGLVLSVTAAACSGSDDPAPTETTPSERTAGSDVPAQPEGADGVTLRIQNWDEYHDDEAVVAWKTIAEATSASVNAGELVATFRESYAEEVRQTYLDAFEIAWSRDLEVPAQGDVRVESAETDGDTAGLVVCQWAPTTDYVKDQPDQIWRKQGIDMERTPDRWVITGIDEGDTCDGGAPS